MREVYISTADAEAVYGVVLDANGEVDAKATARKRAELEAALAANGAPEQPDYPPREATFEPAAA